MRQPHAALHGVVACSRSPYLLKCAMSHERCTMRAEDDITSRGESAAGDLQSMFGRCVHRLVENSADRRGSYCEDAVSFAVSSKRGRDVVTDEIAKGVCQPFELHGASDLLLLATTGTTIG